MHAAPAPAVEQERKRHPDLIGVGVLTLLIDGKSVPSASGKTFDTVSPTTNQPIGRVPLAGIADVEHAIQAERTAFDD
jgi:hypothetical protein